MSSAQSAGAQDSASTAPLSPQAPYAPRRPETTVLYQVVQEHLETLLAQVKERSEHGFGYPKHVEKAFYRYSQCGIFSRGFARCRCRDCGDEFLVPFSCKLRSLCPSCSTRRMHDTALRLADMLPPAGYRQWVLSPPWPRRLPLVKQPELMSALCRIFSRALFCWHRKQARRQGIADGHPGAIAFIHLFGSALNLHPHLHLVVPQGVFVKQPEGAVTFAPCAPPTDEQVAQIAQTVYQRAERMFDAALGEIDELTEADEDTALGADVAQAAHPPRAVELPPDAEDNWEHPAPKKRRCAAIGGYSLHADVQVQPTDRAGLVRLLGYGMRPAFALQRLDRLDDGRVRYRLKRPWPHAGGMTQLVMEPVAFLRRLACLIPPPRRHLIRYLGVFAPNAALRAALPKPPAASPTADCAHLQSEQLELPFSDAKTSDDSPGKKAYRLLWSVLLARVFSIDILRCPKCGGQRVLVAFITDPPVIEKILTHLGLPTEPPRLAPARAPPQQQMDWGA